MKITIQINGVESVINHLSNCKTAIWDGVALAMSECAEEVRLLAVNYCPISPTKAQINASRKSQNKKQSMARMKNSPGALCRSITSSHKDSSCKVFVASNSEGASYARRIHDEKGKSWWKRGIGTVAKGPQADEKFLTRALNDSRERVFQIICEDIEDALDAVVGD